MIWDDIRKAYKRVRSLDAHVVRAPFELYALDGDPLGPNRENIVKLIPKGKDGRADASWIRPPYQQIVIASRTDAVPSCILVTSINEAQVFDIDRGGDLEGLRVRCGGTFAWAASMDMFTMDGSGVPCYTGLAYIYVNKSGEVYHVQQAEAGKKSIADKALGLGVRLGLDLSEVDDAQIDGMRTYLGAVTLAVLAIMCCKNVVSTTRQPARQLRRAAERAGLPLVSWHELIVRPSAQHGDQGPGSGEEHNALHWVRGHFKDYREGGIFGRTKGVYWWSPHLAGQADRVALKAYSIPEVPA